jgi:glycosyltransferase involved in cell wall biosynthesis
MLAIVIPFYKLAFFEETLKSLANQTDKRFKVYIGDDASPEDCIAILEKYKGQFDYLYHRFDNNIGGISLVKQWKRCLKLVPNTDWFCLLGDDDILDNNFIESFYLNIECVDQNKINLIRYNSIIINDNGEKIKDKISHPKIENSINSLIRKLKGKNRSSLSEFVFRKLKNYEDFFIDFPNAYYSDDLSLLLSTNFNNIYTINDSILYIRRGEFNLSGVNANTKKANQAEFLFYKYLFDNYSEKFTLGQKKIFLFKLNRLIVRTKSFNIYIYTLLNQLKIFDFKGVFYLPKILINKMLWKKKQ